MARLTLDGLRYARVARAKAPPVPVLVDVSHPFASGRAHGLLAAPGSGKTTLMQIIAGLLPPDGGEVRINEGVINHRPPAARRIGLVASEPMVYAKLTVRQNLAIPLRARRMPRHDARRRVVEVLELIGLLDEIDVRAGDLSPALRQKAALARALAPTDLDALLLDDPLRFVPADARWRWRDDLRVLQQRTGLTTIIASSDPADVMTIADSIAVMHGGRIVQAGAPEDLFARPEHVFVGQFVGLPGMNVLPVEVDGATARFDGHVVQLAAAPARDSVERFELGVRPEHVRIGSDGVALKIEHVEDAGPHRVVRGRAGGYAVTALAWEGEAIPADPCIAFSGGHVHLYADGVRVAGGAA